MKTVAIIQARMSSTRLPGKVLADLAGEPVLYRVVERARRAETLDGVVVATTDDPADDVLAEFCAAKGIDYFRGSREDVLDRYYRAARRYDARVVVRLTADCPLLDPRVIDRVVRFYHQGDYDYVSNTLVCTYPDGLDTEVIRFAALERAWSEARLKSQREHVTSYITDHPRLFSLANVAHERDLSALRWTVDEAPDLEFVRAVYSGCGGGFFGMPQVLDLLERRPQLLEINKGFLRNEGYLKSLGDDCVVEIGERK